MIIFKGDTYQMRHRIKELGARWNKEKKYWYIDTELTEELKEKIKEN